MYSTHRLGPPGMPVQGFRQNPGVFTDSTQQRVVEITVPLDREGPIHVTEDEIRRILGKSSLRLLDMRFPGNAGVVVRLSGVALEMSFIELADEAQRRLMNGLEGAQVVGSGMRFPNPHREVAE